MSETRKRTRSEKPGAAKEEKEPKSSRKASHGEKEAKAAVAGAPEIVDPASIMRLPIAFPLISEETGLLRKSLKLVQEAAQEKQVYKGIREVTKQIRKGSKGLCLLAADVSPMDAISHLPVHCERHSVAYGWVPSKQDLGTAVMSSRPTAAVMVRAGGSPELAKTTAKAAKAISALPKS